MNAGIRVAIVLLSLLVGGCALSSPAEPLTHVDVFTSGEEGYNTYRIPAIEAAPDGTLLAFAEGRKYNKSDPGHRKNDIDLVLKRSTDGGRTWSKLRILDDPGERWASCNPATVVDRETGQVWVFYCRTKPDRSSLTARPGTDDAQALARSTADGGATWSDPIDLTRVARDFDNWGGSFYGPGGPIQTKSGRLIVPMSKTTGHRSGDKLVAGPWTAFVITSDDHGRTWQRGELLEGIQGSECQVVELADGKILFDVRQDDRGPNRYVSTSDDGGRTWSAPRTGQTVSPVACAVERLTLKSTGDDRDRIVWTGPKGPGRERLVARVSYDEGKTFGNEKVISGDRAAYSDMASLPDKAVGVLWERGGYKFITFSRFGLDFLAITADGK